jgi:hypothetical protein
MGRFILLIVTGFGEKENKDSYNRTKENGFQQDSQPNR